MEYLANTMTAFVQGFVETKTTYHLTIQDMLKITEKVYGKSIQMEEGINETTYEYKVIAKDCNYEHQQDMKEGYVGHWSYGKILEDLCYRKLLEPGDYFIRFTW